MNAKRHVWPIAVLAILVGAVPAAAQTVVVCHGDSITREASSPRAWG